MNILCIGDVFGRPGRKVLQNKLPDIQKKYAVDMTIANIENIAHGKGIRIKDVELLESLNIHVFTGGNHSFSNKEIFKIFEKNNNVIRPANYPPNTPGSGFCIHNNILIINLIGRVFMQEGSDSPFQIVDKILEEQGKNKDGIIVDFHAETSSEKHAMFHYLKGKVSAIFGTHTHVQTADERISEEGTAYISDLGMTGPLDSIIGMKTETVLKKFTTALPSKFEPAETAAVLCGALIKIENKKAVSIERIRVYEEE